jgi:hypothetical protein
MTGAGVVSKHGDVDAEHGPVADRDQEAEVRVQMCANPDVDLVAEPKPGSLQCPNVSLAANPPGKSPQQVPGGRAMAADRSREVPCPAHKIDVVPVVDDHGRRSRI